MYDVDGCLIRKIKLLRINDLALTRDGTVMVMVTQEKLIKVQRLLFDGKDVRVCPPSRCVGCAIAYWGPLGAGWLFCKCLPGWFTQLHHDPCRTSLAWRAHLYCERSLSADVRAQVAVTVVESAPIMSMALSPDNSFILVNLASHTIHLWPVEPLLRQLDALHSGQPISGGPQLRHHAVPVQYSAASTSCLCV